jgi:hypothetical protein
MDSFLCGISRTTTERVVWIRVKKIQRFTEKREFFELQVRANRGEALPRLFLLVLFCVQ